MRSRAGGFIITRVATHSLGPGARSRRDAQAQAGSMQLRDHSWQTLQEA